MKRNIKLSIVIVNFNTGGFLKKCINSIKNSRIDQSILEIIIIDNASTDNSLQIVSESFDNIFLIINKKNRGFSSANNVGIGRSSGEYVLLLNPDTVLSDDTLEKTFAYIKQEKNIGILTCEVRLKDGNLDDACHRGFPTPWNAFCQFTGLSSLLPKSSLFNGYHLGYQNMEKIHEIDSCSGAFMLIRRQAGEAVGWLDEDYFWYGEDIDFCYRVKKEGWKVIYYPKARILHYKGVSSGIKKHSKIISTATRETKLKATRARFEVMRVFYKKHYVGVYPDFITKLILKSIKIKENFHLLGHKI